MNTITVDGYHARSNTTKCLTCFEGEFLDSTAVQFFWKNSKNPSTEIKSLCSY